MRTKALLLVGAACLAFASSASAAGSLEISVRPWVGLKEPGIAVDQIMLVYLDVANRSSGTVTIGDITSPDFIWRNVQCKELPEGWSLPPRGPLLRGPMKPVSTFTLAPGKSVTRTFDLRYIFDRIDLRNPSVTIELTVGYADGTILSEDVPILYQKWEGTITLPIRETKGTVVTM